MNPSELGAALQTFYLTAFALLGAIALMAWIDRNLRP